ncbi:Hypothetical predicted protein, partial [Pelobates cultripes]
MAAAISRMRKRCKRPFGSRGNARDPRWPPCALRADGGVLHSPKAREKRGKICRPQPGPIK